MAVGAWRLLANTAQTCHLSNAEQLGSASTCTTLFYVKSLKNSNCSGWRQPSLSGSVEGTQDPSPGSSIRACSPKDSPEQRGHCGPLMFQQVPLLQGLAEALAHMGRNRYPQWDPQTCHPESLAGAAQEAFHLSQHLIPLPGWALLGGGSFDVLQVREGFSSLPRELRWGEGHFLSQRSQLAAYLSR